MEKSDEIVPVHQYRTAEHETAWYSSTEKHNSGTGVVRQYHSAA